MSMKPDLCQFMIYNPNPGTPLYEKVKAGGLLRQEYETNPARYWKWASGFKSLLEHPRMSAAEIEAAQENCFKTDFRELGPSIYRVAETMLTGYLRHKDSANAFLRAKAQRYAGELRKGYPVFLAGQLFGPTLHARALVYRLKKKMYAELGQPSFADDLLSFGAVLAALWTSLKLRFNLFQNPALTRATWRLPPAKFSREWLAERIAAYNVPQKLSVLVEEYGGRKNQLRVRLEGALDRCQGEKLAEELRAYLKETRGKLVLDLEKLKAMEKDAASVLSLRLDDYRSRVKVALPRCSPAHAAQFLFVAEMFKHYKC